MNVVPGTILEIRLQPAGSPASLDIALAAVRWAKETEFGAEFLQLRADAQERLRLLVARLEQEHLG